MTSPARWPWWVQVLAVHALARLFSAVVLVVVARSQAATPWTPAGPGYLEYTGLMWDASWYRQVAEVGYPSDLPTGADGAVVQNAWAFLPLFPLLVRAIMAATGAPWAVAGPLTATVLGALAMLVLHRLVVVATERAGRPPRDARRLALATVGLVTTSAAAPVLQVAYSESLALLLLAAVLLCLVRERYLAASGLVLLLGLTRPVALAVGAAVLAHLVARLRTRAVDARAWSVAAPVLGLGAVTAVSGVLWLAVAAAATGVPDAYTRTQAAWRGTGQVVPVRPWLDVAQWLLGSWGLPVLALLVALAVAAVLSSPVRRLGPELQGWAAGYLAYLLAVVEPGTSLVRFGLLAFPLAAGLAAWALTSPRWPAARLGALLVIGLVTQVVWVAQLWRLVPPSGWPP
ncbi:hypothetical protein GXB85_09200 [Cellulomonas sp. APG4]|uniref:hypothetical protein n=1 Tax=Cellulomonas sp. APG4 TaxID=1538656 RepID=UPI00137B2C04|nr:hypothetical protein [Cellulomonas sp. APG4]NCT91124.1 hypothetical protein [Cellulomonas sp. APG4]